ncbi:pimeloyl-ACP methyl ester carboxylesterase [Hasllibacter halocynthiae]|uniref:Pimeloyl-ACP methyl ester carboxylesterase n=1 Tax=Hasllibacter halocynthiae TaxID=595589 RepID=A0A2T0X456_9RHOB|nr:alpha/beta fold hydrolase [Hasllibacter halocynthiae]PRY93728.1 pimeloyl-ACP methyl ester carboxylesterase [Hasllibacter halocynthiae]
MILERAGFGDGPARPLLVAHGLFGSGRNWSVIARRLSDRGRVVTVDMRNHGASGRSGDHSYPAMARDLAETIEAEGGGAWDVIGHSMGGKAAMTLALARPDLVHALVVADIAPIAYDHTQRHLIEAMRALDPATVSSRGEADAALAKSVDDPGVRAFLLQSLDVRDGRWALNLDALDAAMDGIVGWHDPGGTFDGPALFLAGGESDYVPAEARGAIRALFPRARIARIPGAGHWLHAEKPREFVAAVRAFLDRA